MFHYLRCYFFAIITLCSIFTMPWENRRHRAHRLKMNRIAAQMVSIFDYRPYGLMFLALLMLSIKLMTFILFFVQDDIFAICGARQRANVRLFRAHVTDMRRRVLRYAEVGVFFSFLLFKPRSYSPVLPSAAIRRFTMIEAARPDFDICLLQQFLQRVAAKHIHLVSIIDIICCSFLLRAPVTRGG